MKLIKILLIVHVLVACKPGNVSSQSTTGATKTPLGPVQKVLAKFFGCPPVSSESANVVCTLKNKVVDCNTQLPVKTQATFNCSHGLILSESYNNIVCQFRKKWFPQPPKCISPSEPDAPDESTTSTQPPITTASTKPPITTAANVPTTTTRFVKENHVNPFPTQPLKLPVKVKTYEGVGTLSLPDLPAELVGKTINASVARKTCEDKKAKLMYLDTALARDALESMLILSQEPKGAAWLDTSYDNVNKKFFFSGVEVNPGFWCIGEPSVKITPQECTRYSILPQYPNQQYCIDNINCSLDFGIICRE